ncbi:MAG: hypothetical protein NTY17_11180 [Planctomycetia bacterium]|nr:hypothetical protein [Planctomycetia bacterium]
MVISRTCICVRAILQANVLVIILSITCAAVAAAGEQPGPFPATVRVIADHTYLRAGPGDDFYPTERLIAGTAVEVWAVDPSGYVALRPVDGSFSWLRACDVDAVSVIGDPPTGQASGRGVGVIVTDGAVSRVGSQLNDLRHVAHVSLEAGERVQVIDEVRIAAGRHAGLWVRIEPPAGEFRWAWLGDLEVPPGVVPPTPAVAATADAPDGNTASIGEAMAAIKDASVAVAQALDTQAVDTQLAGKSGAAALDTQVGTDRGAPALGTQLATGTQMGTGAPVAPPQQLGFMPSARRLFAGWLPRGTSVFDPATPVTPVAVTGGAAVSGDELADIDLALSLAVTGPAEAWNLPPVRERLRQAAARTATDIDRTRVEAIDARISRFETIQSRHRTLAAAPPPAADPSLQLGGMWSSLSAIGGRPIRPGVMPGGGSADGQPTWTPPDMTETSGRLATVVSRRPDAPRWAVVDQSNNVIAFITPQTGVNLAPLVGQDVAVRGARGYMPEYKRPYVVASEARVRIAAAPEASPDRATR